MSERFTVSAWDSWSDDERRAWLRTLPSEHPFIFWGATKIGRFDRPAIEKFLLLAGQLADEKARIEAGKKEN